jgi:hypothetical protein
MYRFTCLAILLVSNSAFGNPVDDLLGQGVFDVAWGTKLEAVQKRYPGGFTWESTQVHGTHFAYEVQVPTKLFGMDEPNLHVHFFFNKYEQLQEVYLLYKYDQKDVVLYQVADTLGQNYRTQSDKRQLLAQWKSQSGVVVTLSTGSGPPYTWEMLFIDASRLLDK